MFASGTYFLPLALVACHGLTACDNAHLFPVKRPMAWSQSQKFCQRHFIDLAVISTLEEYNCFKTATAGERVSFWIGLQRSDDHSWTWIDGEHVYYEQWKEKYFGDCASFESMLMIPNKMLSRFCEEPHAYVCQGPIGPQHVSWALCSGCVSLSWNVSAFMQMTPHSYTVKACSSECNTSIYHFSRGTSTVTVHISNITNNNYTFEITASVSRPDNNTGRIHVLQSSPTTLQIQTEDELIHSVPNIILKSLKVVFLVPALWIIFLILKKGKLTEPNQGKPLVGITAGDIAVDKRTPLL